MRCVKAYRSTTRETRTAHENISMETPRREATETSRRNTKVEYELEGLGFESR